MWGSQVETELNLDPEVGQRYNQTSGGECSAQRDGNQRVQSVGLA